MESRNDATRRLFGIISHLKTFDDTISSSVESHACSNQGLLIAHSVIIIKKNHPLMPSARTQAFQLEI